MPKQVFTYCQIIIILCSCSGNNETSTDLNSTNTVPIINFSYSNSYPHDTNAFTEGLLIHEGELYESTGDIASLPQTKSLFGIVDLTTGNIDVKVELDRDKYFGEGITILHEKVFQLTLESKTGFVYDINTFEKTGEFIIPGEEGWGLTTDGTNLIMSHGTNKLTFVDPNTFKTIKQVSVAENGISQDNLNELEFIHGNIYANIWQTNTIVKINPVNGKVLGKLDLTPLANEAKSMNAESLEMNGIAYNSQTNKILITGKMWPKIYEISIDFDKPKPAG